MDRQLGGRTLGGAEGPTGRSLFRLLVVGLIAWAATAVGFTLWLLVVAPEPDLLGDAAPFYAWLVGYVPGGLVMLAYGALQTARGRQPGSVVLWTGVVYGAPVALWLLETGAYFGLQPPSAQQDDLSTALVALAGPAVFVLFVVGLVLGLAFRASPLRNTAMVVLAPPLLGVALIGLALVVLAVSSPYWQYRGAFALDVEHVAWRQPQGLEVLATLTVEREGTYSLHALYQERGGSVLRGVPMDVFEIDAISYQQQDWTRSGFELQRGRTYRIRLIWNTLHTYPADQTREVVLRIGEGPIFAEGPLIEEFHIPVPDPGA